MKMTLFAATLASVLPLYACAAVTPETPAVADAPGFVPKPLVHKVMVPEDALDDPALEQTVLKLALYTWARSGDTVIYQLEPGSKYRFDHISLSKDADQWNIDSLPEDRMSMSLKFVGKDKNVVAPVNTTLHLVEKATGKQIKFDPLIPTLPLPK